MVSKITAIHSFLVKPRKGEKESNTEGTTVPLNGKLYEMLKRISDTSDTDCNIDIVFKMAADGSQKNPARELLQKFGGNPTLKNAEEIAHKLELVTTNRSGLGLLFIIHSVDGNKCKTVVSRFPADSGILADETTGALTVEFLERVFMKNARSYKAVAYKNLKPKSKTWKGKAVDKQITDIRNLTSEYWIFDFLESDFVVTSVAGTKRLAEALKKAASISKDLSVKQQIAGAGMLLGQYGGTTTSIEKIAKDLNFSPETIAAIKSQLKNPASINETFSFDQATFDEHFKYRSIVLDNGGVMTADAAKFAEIFKMSKDGELEKFETSGRRIDERIVKRRIGME